MKKDDCIFCKLANGDIPTNTIYEDNDFRVFLDAAPATKGHCLIVPKEHFDNLEELSDDVASKVFPLAKKMMKLLKEKLGWDGFNVVQNNGEVAGQTVFHFHTHLIPRYIDDGQNLNMKPSSPKEGELEEVLNLIVS
ncbi:MAG: HIT family protein [Lachnospiraceae bacterium]|jgi:histidine triad (HIT) family protein|nr:HIT family protein [Lachnospiraceae bacterium]MBQ8006392.1 HIT family protein [Lachnospiraceae bacterium]MBQ8666032.1 HIT family protein [Lachnospiraceae bacterium]MBR1451094.1 HIT family protein [Lachnospiraceae bacterium]